LEMRGGAHGRSVVVTGIIPAHMVDGRVLLGMLVEK